ncbi:MAG: recombinase family protein [Clostridiales bacterium]|nr:recombinase family protein [Clostridiales bacterium]
MAGEYCDAGKSGKSITGRSEFKQMLQDVADGRDDVDYILVQMEGRKQKAREGKWNGGQAPYGYRVDSKNSTLVVESDEMEIVKIIYDKFARTDMEFVGISDYLNKHGYMKSKYRDQELSHFSRGLIKNVLDNPVYTGKITYGRVKNERVKGKRDEYRRIKTDLRE